MTSSGEDALGNQQQTIEAKDGAMIQKVTQTTFNGPYIETPYTRSKREELNDYLTHAVAVYKGYMYQAIAQVSRPSSPYKLLSPFRLEDASIFCGRTNAIEELYKKVFQDRLLVVHAKSGAGKSSLLNAGLSPYLISQGRLPLYIYTYDKDPVLVIKQALVPAKLGPWPDGLHDLSLHQFLAYACERLKRDNIEELIIVLDQFEDFFLYKTQSSERLPFIEALGDCYNDLTLPIRIIIALRKDYYSDLTEFEQVRRYFHIGQNHYRPSSMTQEELREAIVKPLKKLNSTVSYDPAVVDTLLAELSRDEIELPLLQIICTRLYEKRKDKKRITLKMYEALGKTEGVLKSYLNEVLAGLPEKEKVLTKDILKEFVRSDLTKQTLSENKLIARVKSTKDELDRILARLVNARLLHRDDIEGETRYELVHEYLTTEICKWIDSADREFKRAEELLRNELATWRSYHHLIPLERLELLYPYREHFRGLDTKDWECLLRSAIKAESDIGDEFPGADVTDWVNVVRDTDSTLLFKAIVEPLITELQDKNSYTRGDAAEGLAKIGKDGDIRAVEPLITELQNGNWHAAEALGKLGDLRAFEPLITALQDKDSIMRRQAAEGLGELGDIRAVEPLISGLQNGNWSAAEALGRLGDLRAFEPLITALQDKDSIMRRQAAEGLGELRDVRAVEPLIAVLPDENDLVRRKAAEALGKLGDVHAFEPLITALQDKDKSVRQKTAEALGRLGDARAIEPLIVLLEDKDSDIRWQATGALGDIRNANAIDALIIALQDKNSNVRDCAAWALGNIGDSRAVESLIISLQDKDSNVREYAAWALGEIGDMRAVESLINAAQDKDKDVRESAIQALENIKSLK